MINPRKDFYKKLEVESVINQLKDNIDPVVNAVVDRLHKEILYLDQQLYIRNKYVSDLEFNDKNLSELIRYLRAELAKVEHEKETLNNILKLNGLTE